MAATKKNPKGTPVLQMVEFKLTDEQKAKKGEEAAKLSAERDELMVQKKIEMDALAGRIKDKSARISTLLGEINKGTERREVSCIEAKNFEDNKVEYWFEGEKVKERDMTELDRQQDLPMKEMKTGAPTKAGKATKGKPGKAESEGDTDVRAVHREETSARSKWSAVDGART